MTPTLVVITGPTGVGKTATAIGVAQALSAEIISADSRQVYRDIPIGTAAPSAQELAQVPHHFVGMLGLGDYYSAAQFESDVMDLDDLKTAVWVRVTVSDDVASDMLQLMVNSLDRVLSDLKQYTTNVVESRTVITFYSVPELHQYTEYGRVSGWVIFILVVVVLIIIALVSFFLWTRLKNKKTKNGAKKLKAASTAKKGKAQKDSKKARV